MSPSDALFEIGLTYKAAKICLAESHILLAQLSTDHCQYMADHNQLGHQNFKERYNICREKLGLNCAEIAAMSWKSAYIDNPQDEFLLSIAHQMWDSWRQSRGHWNIATAEWKFVGGDMTQAKDGTWYASILTGK
jgi:uncharacterized protein YkwD